MAIWVLGFVCLGVLNLIFVCLFWHELALTSVKQWRVPEVGVGEGMKERELL